MSCARGLAGLLLSVIAANALAAETSQRNPDRKVRVAIMQAGLEHGERDNPGFEANFELFSKLAREAAAEKPELIVFPEYAVSGWPYPEGELINTLAETIPGDGPWYQRHVALAQELKTPLLCWLVGKKHGKLVSTSFLLDGEGKFVGSYDKVQANLGEQTWWGWSQGDAFRLIELNGVRYGVSICADMWFPETVRCYELLGADAVIHQSIGDDMQHIIPTRAFDSALPIVAAINRGGGYVVNAEGEIVGKMAPEQPAWKVFEIEPFRQRSDRKYGGRWIPELGHRNLRNIPAYSVLTDPATRPRWTEIFQDNQGRPQTEEQLKARFQGRWDANDPVAAVAQSTTNLGIEGTRFTINGRPEFLMGISYYGGTGASADNLRKDLDDIQKLGFNWIRVWASWRLFDRDVSAIDPDGNAREPYFSKLQELVRECDRRGLLVDVTLIRGPGRVAPGVRDLAAHERAVETLVRGLKAERNWYLDLGNECDVLDDRYINIHELKVLRDLAKTIDPHRVITASFANDISAPTVADLVRTVQVDVLSIHRPRDPGTAAQTEGHTRGWLKNMAKIGRSVPVHFQEPFRRGYQGWEPTADDFATDVRGAIAGGAAGWCYHNGDQRTARDGQPARSFDLTSKRLFDQFDSIDQEQMAAAFKALAESRQTSTVSDAAAASGP